MKPVFLILSLVLISPLWGNSRLAQIQELLLSNPHSKELPELLLEEINRPGKDSDESRLINHFLSLPSTKASSYPALGLLKPLYKASSTLTKKGRFENANSLLKHLFLAYEGFPRSLHESSSNELKTLFNTNKPSDFWMSSIKLFSWVHYHLGNYGFAYKLARSLENHDQSFLSLMGSIYLYGPLPIRQPEMGLSYLKEASRQGEFNSLYMLSKFHTSKPESQLDYSEIYFFTRAYALKLQRKDIDSYSYPFVLEQNRKSLLHWGRVAQSHLTRAEIDYLNKSIAKALHKDPETPTNEQSVEKSSLKGNSEQGETTLKMDPVLEAKIQSLEKQLELYKVLGDQREISKIQNELDEIKKKSSP